MDREFEIYFSDLTKKAQKRFLKYMKIKDEKELNFDIIPLCVLEGQDDDEDIVVNIIDR